MAGKVVSIGELLFDIFPDGERLGGAPANFAWHASTLGADVVMLSAVGDDSRGALARDTLSSGGVNITGIGVSGLPTGIVSVSVSADGQPSYEIVADVAWDEIEFGSTLEPLVKDADVVCWGTLGQRSCRSLNAHRQLFEFLPDRCLRVFDVNIRAPFYTAEVIDHGLRNANLLKLNDQEIPVLRCFWGGPSDDREFLKALRWEFGIDTIVLTLGEDGCRVFSDDIDFKEPCAPVDVANTVGAGDAFMAGFVLQMLVGADLKTCARRANQIGAFVATQYSGMPSIPDHLRE